MQTVTTHSYLMVGIRTLKDVRCKTNIRDILILKEIFCIGRSIAIILEAATKAQ